MDSGRQAEKYEIWSFHNTKYKAYPYKRLNTSKEVIRRRELAFATAEKMSAALEKQRVTNIRKISIGKGEEQIQTHIYILTFNQPHIPQGIKIGYCLEKVEKYVPTLLRCFKCQNMDTTVKLAEDDWHVSSSMNKNWTIWRKIA